MNLLGTATGRKVLFGALYFSEGAPIGFIWWALPTWLRARGVAIDTITVLTASLTLLWTLKWLWAPMVDLLRERGCGLRAWILWSQGLMGLTLLPLLVVNGVRWRALALALLACHALAATTQDVAIDALAIRQVPAEERGALNGWMQVGMLLGRSLFGGGALLMASRIGDRAVLTTLVAAIWVSGTLVLLSRERPVPGVSTGRAVEPWILPALLRNLGRVVTRRSSLVGLAFALTSGAAFEGVGAVAGPLLVDAGATKEQAGWFFAGPAVGAMLAGALLGGYLADRWGRRRCAGLFLGLIILDALGLALLLGARPPDLRGPLVPLLGALYGGIGLFTAASYALFMDLTDPAFGATQFSLFMGATNGCEAWAGLAAGTLIASRGYEPALLLLALASALSLPLLALLPSGEGGGPGRNPASAV